MKQWCTNLFVKMTVTNKWKYTNGLIFANCFNRQRVYMLFFRRCMNATVIPKSSHHIWLFFTGLWHSNLEVNKADGIYVSVARCAIHIVPNHKNNDTYTIVYWLEIVVRLYFVMFGSWWSVSDHICYSNFSCGNTNISPIWLPTQCSRHEQN